MAGSPAGELLGSLTTGWPCTLPVRVQAGGHAPAYQIGQHRRPDSHGELHHVPPGTA